MVEIFKYSKEKIIDFLAWEKIIWFFSGAICLFAIVGLGFKGLNLSLEFLGGTQLEIKSEASLRIKDISAKLEQLQFKNFKVQTYGSTKNFLIRLGDPKKNKLKSEHQVQSNLGDSIIAALTTPNNQVSLLQREYIGAEVGEKLLEQGAIAVVISILVTMLYIAIRFEFRLAVSAAVALCHNAIIVLGFFSWSHYEFDLATLAAVLAVIGYSLNDTIVIFDRIRENLRKYHNQTAHQVVNVAINQTLSRTLITSILTLLVVLSLLFFGGKSLFGFAVALAIGIIVGTYASICLTGSCAILIGLSRKDFLKR